MRRDIRRPTLLRDIAAVAQVGRRAAEVSADVLHGLRALRPDLAVTTFEAPHFLLQRRPEEAAARIAAFFAQSRRADA